MTEQPINTTFASHAIVELMGHVKVAGWCTETTIAGAGFVRVDIPDDAGGVKAVKYCAPGSIYAITPCDEETARYTANPKPWNWRQQTELEAAGDDDEDQELADVLDGDDEDDERIDREIDAEMQRGFADQEPEDVPSYARDRF